MTTQVDERTELDVDLESVVPCRPIKADCGQPAAWAWRFKGWDRCACSYTLLYCEAHHQTMLHKNDGPPFHFFQCYRCGGTVAGRSRRL